MMVLGILVCGMALALGIDAIFCRAFPSGRE